MRDWKTTISAAVTVFFGFVSFSPEFFPAILVALSKYVALGGLMSFGIAAADRRKP